MPPIVCSLLLAVCFLLPADWGAAGASLHSAWYTHFTAQWLHANAFHLLANLYALWLLRPSACTLLTAYVLSIPATWASFTPAVGFSSVLYAIVGLRVRRQRWSRTSWILFVAVNACTAFVPSIAFGVHMAAFLFGMGYAWMKDVWDEYRRAYK